jgi:hypothetical protein
VRALESTDLLLKYRKYGNFRLWKIAKIFATKWQISRIECKKFNFG